jgi:hypothetical protein
MPKIPDDPDERLVNLYAMNTTYPFFKRNHEYDLPIQEWENRLVTRKKSDQSNHDSRLLLNPHFKLFLLTIGVGLFIALALFLAVAKFLIA